MDETLSLPHPAVGILSSSVAVNSYYTLSNNSFITALNDFDLVGEPGV